MPLSMPVNALCSVADGDDYAIGVKYGVGVEVGLDLFVGIVGNLPAEPVPRSVIEEENRSSPVIVGVTAEVEQVLDDVRWDASLLKP